VLRRAFLGRLGLGAGALALGGAADRAFVAGQRAYATPESFTSTVSMAPTLGGTRLWWSATTDEQVAALTFDDGPLPALTPTVLDLLAGFGVPATFFMIGALVDRYPDLVRRVRDAGHELANHSYDHVSAAVSGRDQVESSMRRGAEALTVVAGARPRWYRPPGGEITSATVLAAANQAQDIALWSVAGGLGGEVAGIQQHLVSSIARGAIVDLHDGVGRAGFDGSSADRAVKGHRAELTALGGALPRWREAGFRLVTLSELLPSPARA